MHHQSVNQFGSRSRQFERPYLGPNCLQRLSADDTDRQRVTVRSCVLEQDTLIFAYYLLNPGRPIPS